jgi:superfamily II helicase
VTPEQLKQSVIAQIKQETFQDISKLSPKAQDEFIAIYNEFQKNNP